jgi:hypothetical protein
MARTPRTCPRLELGHEVRRVTGSLPGEAHSSRAASRERRRFGQPRLFVNAKSAVADDFERAKPMIDESVDLEWRRRAGRSPGPSTRGPSRIDRHLAQVNRRSLPGAGVTTRAPCPAVPGGAKVTSIKGTCVKTRSRSSAVTLDGSRARDIGRTLGSRRPSSIELIAVRARVARTRAVRSRRQYDVDQPNRN